MDKPKQITMSLRLGAGLDGQQRREDYETAAILAGFTRANGSSYMTTWAREVLDREAKRLAKKHQ